MRRLFAVSACLLALIFNSCKKEPIIANQPIQADGIEKGNFVSGDTLTNGTYVFKNSNGQCFQVATNKSGDVVQQNTYVGLANQQWDVWSLGTGYYKITNHRSKLALDVPGSSNEQNVQLIQYPWNGGDNQQWSVKNRGGYYAFINKHSNLVITLKNNSSGQFTAITQTTFMPDSAHAWLPAMLGLHRISISGNKFVDPNGTEFKLWGLNYVGNQQHTLMEDNWDKPEIMKSIDSDFVYMKFLGSNVVRLQLQFNKYMISSTQPNTGNINRLLQVVEFAKEKDIHLIITGLAAFRPADQPSWYTNTTDAERWAAQANFWKAITGALANNTTILSYDLMNEPIVNSGKTAITSSNWANGGASQTSGDWFVQYITRSPYPGIKNGINNWEAPMHDWIQQLTAAIRTKDATTPITVGYIDIQPYAHFTVDLSYASLHLYPKDETTADASIALYTSAKPLLIEETWPFWFMGMDANALKDYCISRKGAVTGWVSQFFGKTIQEYEDEDPQPLDDYNTLTWFKNFQKIGPYMKTP